MLAAIILLIVVSLDGFIHPIEGIILAVTYILYLLSIVKDEHVVEKNPYHTNYWWDGLVLLIGMALLWVCADIVVSRSLDIAHIFGVTGTFIGTMLIGVATALPELTTVIMALIKKEADLSLGTLIGSNITNPLLALGIGAAISGYQISWMTRIIDIPFWFIVSLLGLLFFWSKMELSKKEASIMIGCYVLFAGIQFFHVL
jgi:cation:H+ antiporter